METKETKRKRKIKNSVSVSILLSAWKQETQKIRSMNHRYQLEKYKGMSSRYHCPNCNSRQKTFVRYIDTETGEHIAPNVGKCERLTKCGYHLPPKQFFEDHKTFTPVSVSIPLRARKQETAKTFSLIPFEMFSASLEHDRHTENNFIAFLLTLFDAETVSELVSRYYIGTSKHWNGATVFWQIDIQGRIRTGKIMLYNPTSGKRVKRPFNHFNWAHKVLNLKDFHLQQCLFGEHLLTDTLKPIAIVESEKTAIIASVYLPQFIWLACGGLSYLTAERCKVLAGRKVLLFPDLKCFDQWSSKAKELSFTVSDLLERNATEAEKEQGFDLADYLLKIDAKEFLEAVPKAEPPAPAEQKAIFLHYKKEGVPNDWSYTTADEIAELEKMIDAIQQRGLPKTFQLDKCTKITDVPKFLEAHLATVKGGGNLKPYLQRLIKFISLN